MTAANYPAVMDEVFRHEGGYVNHPKDPGGETKYGITKRSYPGLDILNLTKEQARAIYRHDFWEPLKGDQLPAGLDLVAMDASVNSGLARGPKWLQGALGVAADGVIGPATLKRAQQANPFDVIPRACSARMGFLRGLRTWGTFGKGWTRRVASVEAVSMKMAAKVASVPVADVRTAGADQASKAATRDAQKAGGAGAAGGVSVNLADLPDWGVALAAVAVAVVIIIALGQRRFQLARAEAYRNLLED